MTDQWFNELGDPAIYLGPNYNITIKDNQFGTGKDSVALAGLFSDSLIENNFFGGESSGVIFIGTPTENNIFRYNYACPKTEEVMNQIFIEPETLITEESIGNNFDTYTNFTPEWPVYGEHFLYCNETWDQPTKKETISFRR
jgi:hypothetical protein